MSLYLRRLESWLDRRAAWAGYASVLAQLLLVVYAFRRLVFHPGQYLIIDHYDGIKSYFSIESFFRQPIGQGMVVMSHNYPFGEYMYYTDSTPLWMQMVHVLVQAVPSLQPYGLYIYDLGILCGLVLATGLLHLIVRRWQLPLWLHVLVCIVLPWICPQTIRLQVGHMSLSYAPAVLFGIWVLQELYLRHAAGKPLLRWLVVLALGILVASYLHFYYLPMLGLMAGFFMVAWAIDLHLQGKPWWPMVRSLTLALVGALIVTAGSLMLLDGRYNERPVGANGYDWIDWKLQFRSFFQAPLDNRLRFLIDPTAPVPYESTAYLGAMALFALVTFGVLKAIKRLPASGLNSAAPGRFLLLLLLASVPMVLIAFGEKYELDGGAYVFHNYLNPFLWVHKVTERITQFRTLARFVWPFWWAVNFILIWALAHGWRKANWAPARWLAVILPLLLLPDLAAALRFYRKHTALPNLLTWPDARQDMAKFTQGLDPKKYQAILPIPYTHVGSEGDYGFTIDPDDPHCKRTYQLSLLTNLPLMSNKAARTPPHQAQQLFTIFQQPTPDPALLSLMSDKPVLVYLDSTYYNGSNNFYRETLKDRAGMLDAFERGDDFIRERNLRLLRREGTWSLYEWYPKQPGPTAVAPAQP